MARSRSGLWAALAVAVVIIVGVLVFTQTRPDRHDDAGDLWITTQVQARYFADTGVTARDISAITRDGVVTLTGTVESERERQRAVQLAREVDGVRNVVDNLQVQLEVAQEEPPREDVAPGEPGPERDVALQEPDERRPQDRVEDAWITTNIQSRYFLDTDIRGRHIDVTTEDGVVTLEGEVQSEAERERALGTAREIEGVREVQDRLRVVPDVEEREEPRITERVDDAWITTRIQAQYFLDADIKGRDISVSTADGVVTLTGNVRTDAEREQAVAIARNIEGVREVEDRLTVTPELEPEPTTGIAAPDRTTPETRDQPQPETQPGQPQLETQPDQPRPDTMPPGDRQPDRVVPDEAGR